MFGGTKSMGLVCATVLAAASAAPGCGKSANTQNKESQPANAPGAAPTVGNPKAPTGPVRIAFGDCAGGSTRFVSGPRPMPFDMAAADATSIRAAKTIAERKKLLAKLDARDRRGQATPEPKDPPPPPPTTKPEPRKPGAPAALEEGKMGKRDSTRQTGSYASRQRKRGLDGLKTKKGGAFESLTGTADYSSGVEDADIYRRLAADAKGSPATGVPGPVGRGYGGLAGRRSPRPSMSYGPISVTPGLPKAIIRRILRMNRSRLRHCYERQFPQNETVEGEVVAKLVINDAGRVVKSAASGVHAKVSACVKRVTESMRFPRPADGVKTVSVSATFQFTPADTRPVAPRSNKPPAPYTAGKDNPLASLESNIASCLRKGTVRHGVAFVALTPGPSNAVDKAEVVGVKDATVSACIAAAAKRARLRNATSAPIRCPFAFGNMPLDATETVDITADKVLYEGEAVASVKAIVADPSLAWRIPKLYSITSQKEQRRRVTVGFEPIAVRGPGVIRPVPSAPMKVVYRVLKSVQAAGGFWALAEQTNAGWRLLRSATLPAAPVPIVTGRSWLDASTPGRFAVASTLIDEEPVKCSVLVTADSIWVGLSRVNDFRQIKKTGPTHDWAAVDQVLAEHKKSSYFQDRFDIEVGAEDDVAYRDVVKAIEHMTNAGFSEWAIARPGELSAKIRQ